MALIRLSPLQLRAYQFLREGFSESQVAEKLHVSRSTILRLASRCVAEGFLIRTTTLKPFMFGPGPRANEADLFAVSQKPNQSAADGVACCGTTAKGGQDATSIRTAKTHHVKVHFEVEKIGDLEEIKFKQDGVEYRTPFLKDAPKEYRGGLKRTYGKLDCPFGKLTIELEENPKSKCSRLFVHLPEIDHTAEQLQNDDWIRLYMELGQSVGNWIQKWGGWKLGLMEISANWEPHHGVSYPEFSDVISKHYAKNGAGDVWTSTSPPGHSELETSSAAKAVMLIEMPDRVAHMEKGNIDLKGEVYELKVTISDLIGMVKHLAEVEEKAIQVITADVEARNGNGIIKEPEYKPQHDGTPAPGYG